MREPTRLPVFLRAWRSGSKVCALSLMAIMLMASSATAKIWETPEQVIARSKRNAWGDIIGIQTDRWQGKPMVYVHYRNGAVVTHVFGRSGRQIAMYTITPERFSPKDIVDIQNLYPTSWRGTGVKDGIYSWQSRNGLGMIAQRHATFDFVAISDISAEQEVAAYATYLEQQLAAPTAVAPEVSEDNKDCLIVATEMQARLRGSAQWSRIAAFSWKVGAKRYGHAVVFYQPDVNSNVFFYDKGFGSIDLGTQSHELPELIGALNELYDAGAQNPRWIGGN